jgi:hypothetical protein
MMYDLMTRAEATLFLGVDAKFLESCATRKLGPPFLKLSRKNIRYIRSELLEWMESRRVAFQGSKSA